MAVEVVEIGYGTWGSYGQYSRVMAILLDGTVVDPRRLIHLLRRGDRVKKTITVNGKEYTIEIVDNSSRKNTKIAVYVPREIVKAVIKDSASSSGWKGFSVLEGGGEVVAVDEERTEENGKYRVIRTVRVYYYVDGEFKVPIEEKELSWRKEAIGKPSATIMQVDNVTIVQGDTYQFREQLKQAGFAWDPILRAWYAFRSADSTKAFLESLGFEVETKEPDSYTADRIRWRMKVNGVMQVACREALYSGLNLQILESLERRGKVRIVSRMRGGLIIYKPSPDITFDDVLEAVKEAEPWLSEERARELAAIFWATSVVAPYASVDCD